MAKQSYIELLRTYLGPLRWRVALLALLLFSLIGLQLASPQIVRAFVDRAVAGEAVSTLLVLAGAFIAVALVTQTVSLGVSYLSAWVGWSATNAMRADLALHCLGLDMPFHKSRTPGVLIERIDGDVTKLAKFFSDFVLRIIGSVLLLVGILVVLWFEDWRVGLALTLFSLVAAAVLVSLRNVAVASSVDEQESSANLYGFVEERLEGLDDLRANGAGAYTMRRMMGVAQPVFLSARGAMMRRSVLWTTTMGLFAVGYTLALGMGAWLFLQGEVTIGTVFLIFQYTTLLEEPIEEVASQLREFQAAAASIVRVRELSAIRSSLSADGSATLPDGPLALELDNVTFVYNDADGGRATEDRSQQHTMHAETEGVTSVSGLPPPVNMAQHHAVTPVSGLPSPVNSAVLNNLSLNLKPGHVLGLLGRTGSGKTSLTRLLLRLYDPTAGAVRLGGVDLRALQPGELRQRVAIVTQDVQLFQASLRDNLTLFDASVPDEQIHAALQEVGLAAWLESLPQGLDSEIAADGLSAGEAQLLALARVFLRNPGLVILDEASSRLDPATERLIERAIDRLLHNRTAIIIAHRLGTVQRADEILILENGAILEHGPRAALAAQPDTRFAHLLRVGMEEMLV
ncbi:MAG: ABC transporter ATP-binding protein/permease [Chloroflexaceae bacterium]|nr:ABC transporter ATP-binding protein/permease [Chloroflexaceae bacterium]